jgi:undecaprenyl-phosphate 4-deoxy-4-formamido-L-arabinose transferase
MSNTAVHNVSVVIPVYGGSTTLQQVVNELSSFYSEQVSEGGNRYQVAEVILVDDCGVDNSAKVTSSARLAYAQLRAARSHCCGHGFVFP